MSFLKMRWYWLVSWMFLGLWLGFLATGVSQTWRIIAVLFVLKNVLVLVYGKAWKLP